MLMVWKQFFDPLSSFGCLPAAQLSADGAVDENLILRLDPKSKGHGLRAEQFQHSVARISDVRRHSPAGLGRFVPFEGGENLAVRDPLRVALRGEDV